MPCHEGEQLGQGRGGVVEHPVRGALGRLVQREHGHEPGEVVDRDHGHEGPLVTGQRGQRAAPEVAVALSPITLAGLTIVHGSPAWSAAAWNTASASALDAS